MARLYILLALTLGLAALASACAFSLLWRLNKLFWAQFVIISWLIIVAAVSEPLLSSGAGAVAFVFFVVVRFLPRMQRKLQRKLKIMTLMVFIWMQFHMTQRQVTQQPRQLHLWLLRLVRFSADFSLLSRFCDCHHTGPDIT